MLEQKSRSARNIKLVATNCFEEFNVLGVRVMLEQKSLLIGKAA